MYISTNSPPVVKHNRFYFIYMSLLLLPFSIRIENRPNRHSLPSTSSESTVPCSILQCTSEDVHVRPRLQHLTAKLRHGLMSAEAKMSWLEFSSVRIHLMLYGKSVSMKSTDDVSALPHSVLWTSTSIKKLVLWNAQTWSIFPS